MTTLRAHLIAIISDPSVMETNASDHAVAALAILDAAEADMFDEETGMVALVPDGTVWALRNGIGPWIRTDRPDPLAPDPPATEPT